MGVSLRGSSPYFEGLEAGDVSVSPGMSDQIMSQFPPSLFISSTQDFMMSSAVHTHGQLVRLGVEADLHVWEGLGHAFILYTRLPEAHQAFDVIVKFFAHHLGH